MRLYNYNIVLLLKRLSLSIFLFFISRLFFYIFNYNLYTEIGLFELTKLFFYGLRFDLSVISYFNILFIIFMVLFFKKNLLCLWLFWDCSLLLLVQAF